MSEYFPFEKQALGRLFALYLTYPHQRILAISRHQIKGRNDDGKAWWICFQIGDFENKLNKIKIRKIPAEPVLGRMVENPNIAVVSFKEHEFLSWLFDSMCFYLDVQQVINKHKEDDDDNDTIEY